MYCILWYPGAANYKIEETHSDLDAFSMSKSLLGETVVETADTLEEAQAIADNFMQEDGAKYYITAKKKHKRLVFGYACLLPDANFEANDVYGPASEFTYDTEEEVRQAARDLQIDYDLAQR